MGGIFVIEIEEHKTNGTHMLSWLHLVIHTCEIPLYIAGDLTLDWFRDLGCGGVESVPRSDDCDYLLSFKQVALIA